MADGSGGGGVAYQIRPRRTGATPEPSKALSALISTRSSSKAVAQINLSNGSRCGQSSVAATILILDDTGSNDTRCSSARLIS